MARASRAGCTTRCTPAPAGSACTTTRRSRSAGCCQGAERIAYVDVDVHHGDGVQAAFYNDPRVLTISLHEHPDNAVPRHRHASETGGPGAKGSAVNVALPAVTRDAGWLRAFHAVVPPVLRQFRPQILVSQHGCDTHRDDPLTNLELTIDAQRAAHAAIHRLAHEVAGGRGCSPGAAATSYVQVVPRSWTHLLAEAGGPPDRPRVARRRPLWREYVSAAPARRPGDMTEAAGDVRSFEPATTRPIRSTRPSWPPGGRLPPARPRPRPGWGGLRAPAARGSSASGGTRAALRGDDEDPAYAGWATWAATEPIISRVKPPVPREPRTIRSASLPASMSSSTTKPWTALTVTESGRGPASPASTLSVSAWASWAGLFGPGRVIRVDGHAAVVTPDGLAHGDHRERHPMDRRSCMARSRARWEWPEPSTPTIIPDISFSLRP